ncbi:MAG: ABC transporter substrate-binding protein [Candidatus Magasanikbacteria bacterium]
MKKKFLLLFTILLGVTLLGIGCKGLSQKQKRAVQPVTINYWTVFGDMDQLQKFAKEFEQRRGGYVDIQIRKVRFDEFHDLFIKSLADNVAPDIVSMHTRWLRKHRQRLAPMPSRVQVANLRVSGKFSKTKKVNFKNQFMPTLTDVRRTYVSTVPNDVIINDQVYGLPMAMDTLALYYNKDILDKSGVAQPPKTWSELQKAVKATTKYDSEGNIVQSGIAMGTSENINNSFDILSVLMMQNGTQMSQNRTVTFANGLGKNTKQHPSYQALKFYTNFAREEKAVYSWNENRSNALEEFIRGNTAFYIGFAHNQDEINQRAPQMTVRTVPLPQLNPSNPANIANYWVQSVVKESDNKQLAWSFVRYLTNPENVKRYTEAVNQPTPFRSQIEAQKENADLRPFLENILTAENWYRGKNLEAAKQAFADMIEGFKRPAPEEMPLEERNANLIGNAARKVQQTF